MLYRLARSFLLLLRACVAIYRHMEERMNSETKEEELSFVVRCKILITDHESQVQIPGQAAPHTQRTQQ